MVKAIWLSCIAIPSEEYTKDNDFSLIDYKINKPEEIASIVKSM